MKKMMSVLAGATALALAVPAVADDHGNDSLPTVLADDRRAAGTPVSSRPI